jgi:hypothetical protein
MIESVVVAPVFLKPLTVDGVWWLAVCPGHFTPGYKDPTTQ